MPTFFSLLIALAWVVYGCYVDPWGCRDPIWHPSQVTQRQPDGSAVVTMNLSITVELISFILGWGEKMEVLKSEELREQVAVTARQVWGLYKKK